MVARKNARTIDLPLMAVLAAAGLVLGGCNAVPTGLAGGTLQPGGSGGQRPPSLGSLPQPPVPLPPLRGGSGPAAPTLSSIDSSSGSAVGSGPGTGPAAPGDLGGAPTGDRSAFEVEVDRWMLALINKERQAVGSQPLRIDPRLHAAAWKHTVWMFGAGRVDHNEPDGSWGHDRAAREGFPIPGGMDSVNENVADVFSRDDPQALATTCIDEYRQSDGHWKNLLDPRWNVVGLATIYRPGQAQRDSYGETVNPNTQLFGKL